MCIGMFGKEYSFYDTSIKDLTKSDLRSILNAIDNYEPHLTKEDFNRLREKVIILYLSR